MLCSFTNQVLAQLDLLKCRKGTTATGFLACLHRVANSSERRFRLFHRWHAPSLVISISMPGRACQDFSALIYD